MPSRLATEKPEIGVPVGGMTSAHVRLIIAERRNFPCRLLWFQRWFTEGIVCRIYQPRSGLVSLLN